MKKQEQGEQQRENMNLIRALVLILQGALVGVGGILPGVSGSILCVIFGLYQAVIEVLAHPITGLKRHLKLILPMGIGVGLGFLGCAGIVSEFMKTFDREAICLFVGLILGMLPQMVRDARKEGVTKGCVPAAIAAFVVFLALLLFLQRDGGFVVTPNAGWFVFCGVAWGLSIVVPGLSSSSMLIYFGLYQPMLEGMASFDPSVLIPLAVGACVIIFTLSRSIDRLFARQYALVSHIILGIVVATTIPIIPRHFVSVGQLIVDLACIAAGVVAAILINRLCERVASRSRGDA